MLSPELHTLSIVYLWICAACAVVVAGDIVFAGKWQKMAIMNLVWPVTGLYLGPLALWFYFRNGRKKSKDAQQNPEVRQKQKNMPFWHAVLVGDTHCGAGCTLGDFAGEWLVFLTGLTIAGSVLWANYTIDFILAYIAGIVFQYYSIAPMSGISGWEGIKAAMKADTISLVSFEVGMFATMAVTHNIFNPPPEPTDPVYWFMMQIAMIVGFATAFPANWWLIRKGLKEAM